MFVLLVKQALTTRRARSVKDTRMKSHGGYMREISGTPVSLKGPQSKVQIKGPKQMLTDEQASKAAGYKGITVNKRITS